MLVLNALMKQPVSLSCWGRFDVGRFPVELKAHDYGLVETASGAEFLSVFFVGSESRESRVCADQGLLDTEKDRGLSRRLQADNEVLADFGVDVDTIDWSSAADTDEDRARWRRANIGR